MTDSHSTTPTPAGKSHPFTVHKTGQFCKKVCGKIHYFGKDLAAALEKWNREKNDLLAGRSPKPDVDGLTVASTSAIRARIGDSYISSIAKGGDRQQTSSMEAKK
jgi:hypothetical protein